MEAILKLLAEMKVILTELELLSDAHILSMKGDSVPRTVDVLPTDIVQPIADADPLTATLPGLVPPIGDPPDDAIPAVGDPPDEDDEKEKTDSSSDKEEDLDDKVIEPDASTRRMVPKPKEKLEDFILRSTSIDDKFDIAVWAATWEDDVRNSIDSIHFSGEGWSS